MSAARSAPPWTIDEAPSSIGRRSAGAKYGSNAITDASVIIMDDGLQNGSLSVWIFVVCPPRERPIAWLHYPLFLQRRSDAL